MVWLYIDQREGYADANVPVEEAGQFVKGTLAQAGPAFDGGQLIRGKIDGVGPVFVMSGCFAGADAVEFEVEIILAVYLLDEEFHAAVFMDRLVVFGVDSPQAVAMYLKQYE